MSIRIDENGMISYDSKNDLGKSSEPDLATQRRLELAERLRRSEDYIHTSEENRDISDSLCNQEGLNKDLCFGNNQV